MKSNKSMDREPSSQRLESYASDLSLHPIRTITRVLLEPGYTVIAALRSTNEGEKRTDILMRAVPFELAKLAILSASTYNAVNNYL